MYDFLCKSNKRKCTIALVTFKLIIGFIAFYKHEQITECIISFSEWMENNLIIGSMLYSLMTCVFVICLLPGWMLCIVAGFVYVHLLGSVKGIIVATPLAFFSQSIAATVSFIISRYLLRDWIKKWTKDNEMMIMLDSLTELHGFKITVLLRLAPITPYNILNYLSGLTSISLADYCMSHIGMLPEVIVLVIIGGTVSNLHQIKNAEAELKDNKLFLLVTCILCITCALGLYYIYTLTKKELEKMKKNSAEVLEYRTMNEMDPLWDLESNATTLSRHSESIRRDVLRHSV